MSKEDAMVLRLKGLTYRQIGEALGISRQRAQQLTSAPTAVRNLVVKRTKGQCERCGLVVGNSGHIHHRGTDLETAESYNDVANLQLLCGGCHTRIHGAKVAAHQIKLPAEKVLHTVRLPVDVHRTAKIAAVTEGLSLIDWLGQAIAEKAAREEVSQ
jgi:hypothetical protein